MAKRKTAVGATGETTGSNKNSVTVTYRGNTRVFSLEVQGEDYKKNAKEFAEKHGGTIE